MSILKKVHDKRTWK